MRIALYEPDIPQNVGAVLRLGACLGVPVDIIEPCGFPFSVKGLRRAAMDYAAQAQVTRHEDWAAFRAAKGEARIVLLTTEASLSFARFSFRQEDCLLLGRESAGVPQSVHDAADARIRVPMRPGLRSLNVAMAAAMVLAEAMRQTGALDELGRDDPTIAPAP